MEAAWAGDNVIWVHNSVSNVDVAETSVNVSAASILINNPAPQAQNCAGVVSGWCTVHPLGWVWGTSATNGKPVGKQILTVTAADGTTGTMPDYVYDGFQQVCNGGITYVSGAPKAQGTSTTADWYADCSGSGNMLFPHGAQQIATATADGFGRLEPFFTSVLSGKPTTPITSVSLASIPYGAIYAVNLGDGGIAKIFFDGASATTVNAANGMSLHDSPSGSGTFAF